MKIIFVAPRFHTNQHFWIKTLIKKGHEVNFLVDRKAEIAEHYEVIEPIIVETIKLPKTICTIINLLMRLQGKLPRARLHTIPKIKHLRKEIVRKKPDVVIVRDVGSTLSIATFLLCKINNIPCLLYSQHPLEEPEKKLTSFLQSLRIAPRERITPVRKGQNRYNKNNASYYVPLISDFPYDINTRSYNIPPVKILFIGKFTMERKKHLLLLQAIQKLIVQGYDIHATLIGFSNIKDSLLVSAQEFVKTNQLSNKISLKQNIPFVEMTKEYAKHDVFVLPSINEPFSISPLEAMNHGLPVIITDSNGAQYCVKNKENGFVIRSNSLNDLTEKIKYFYDKKNLKRMSRNAYDYMKKEHSPEVFYQYFTNAIMKNSSQNNKPLTNKP